MPLKNSAVWVQHLYGNKTIRPYLISVGIGIACLFLPILRNFHLESAMAAALAGGILTIPLIAKSSHSLLNNSYKALRALIRLASYIYFAAIPLLVHDLITGCFSVHGLGFWILIPLPTLLLIFSITRLIYLFRVPLPGTIAAVLFIMIALGQWLIEFYTFPQVYFYNHIWGYWPGPIYDETVTLTLALVYFRILTLSWAVLFWILPDIGHSRSSKMLLGLTFLVLTIGYTQLQEMRIITPRQQLENVLGGHIETKHFNIHYDSTIHKCEQIKDWARRHELYYHQIKQSLDLPLDSRNKKIESYIYAHPWQKKEWVGAKYTSYVPVWQEKDQLHLAYPQLESSLEHEMVHVVAKSFGNRLINASWNIGMVEGLAVALAPDVHKEQTLDQIVAGKKPYPDSGQLSSMMSFGGFYMGRSNVGYLTAGSLIQYLLDEYDPEYFKNAYRANNLEEGYPQPFDSLVAGWHGHLDKTPVDSAAIAAADRIFGVPSIFEKSCPHTVSRQEEMLDRFNHLLANRDSLKAIDYLNGKLKKTNKKENSNYLWYRLGIESIRNEKFGKINFPELKPSTDALLRVVMADYEFLQTKSFSNAYKLLTNAADSIDMDRPSIMDVRSDSTKWANWLKLRYKRKALKPNELLDTNENLQRYNLNLIQTLHDDKPLLSYSELSADSLKRLPINTRLLLAENLLFQDRVPAAKEILDNFPVKNSSLTLKQHERLSELKARIQFYQASKRLNFKCNSNQ